MLQYLQRIGKAIMLPIAALPVAGILLGVGGSMLSLIELDNPPSIYVGLIDFIKMPFMTALFSLMKGIGDIIFANLPILFAVGVAVGVAKKDRGTAALASVFGFLVMNTVISIMLTLGLTQLGVVDPLNLGVYETYVTTNLGIFTLNMSVFGGIITGIITAVLHNKFHEIELPQVIGFFSGSRFVPIITSVVMAFAGVVLAYAWPFVQDGIGVFATLIKQAGPIGVFLYGVTERALIPFGLHHVFYTPFWFGNFVEGKVLIDGAFQTVAGANTAYFVQLSNMSSIVGAGAETMREIVSSTTAYMAGKFPLMMFGLPGAAFAMYKCANNSKKKVVFSLLFAAALTSFLTGITEPLEFTFLFVAPLLYVIHCIFAGFAYMIMGILNVFIGMTFSGGAIDFSLFGLLPAGAGVNTNWYMVLIVGVVYAVVYYFMFSFLIKKFNLKTPGREEEEDVKLFTRKDYEGKNVTEKSKTSKDDDMKEKASLILEAFGGPENIVSVDACISRLRIEVVDKTVVQKDVLKNLGAAGVVEVGNGIQAIFGTKSDKYKNLIKSLIKNLENV